MTFTQSLQCKWVRIHLKCAAVNTVKRRRDPASCRHNVEGNLCTRCDVCYGATHIRGSGENNLRRTDNILQDIARCRIAVPIISKDKGVREILPAPSGNGHNVPSIHLQATGKVTRNAGPSDCGYQKINLPIAPLSIINDKEVVVRAGMNLQYFAVMKHRITDVENAVRLPTVYLAIKADRYMLVRHIRRYRNAMSIREYTQRVDRLARSLANENYLSMLTTQCLGNHIRAIQITPKRHRKILSRRVTSNRRYPRYIQRQGWCNSNTVITSVMPLCPKEMCTISCQEMCSIPCYEMCSISTNGRGLIINNKVDI